MPTARQDGPELREYISVLRRRRKVIILVVLPLLGAALAYTFLQTPVYAGTAEVRLQARVAESIFDPNTGDRTDPVREIQTEIRVIRSRPVRLAVQAKVGPAPPVSAQPVGQTDVVRLTARSEDPVRAAVLTNAYASAYIEHRRQQTVDDLLAAAQEIQVKIADIQAVIDTTPEAQRSNLVQQQAIFTEKLDQLDVAQALQSGGVQLVQEADTPTSPVEPRPIRTGVLALGVGLCLGVAVAFLVEYLDDTIKTKHDLESAVPAATVIGMIPAVGVWRDRDQPRVVSIEEPTSPVAEAYRTLRTGVQFLGLDEPLRSLQITSASAEEGKTTVLANLAVALAKAGSEIVVIDCDLRRPRLHEFFGLSNKVGFTSVLLGEVPLSAALQVVPGVERLKFLASGPMPPNPSELLSSRRAIEVLGPLQTDNGLILVDSPPILPVTDALVLSRHMDAIVMVAVEGRTSRRDAARAAELLGQVNAPLVGTILNGVTDEGFYGYAYQYYGTPESASDQPINGRSRRKSGREASRLS